MLISKEKAFDHFFVAGGRRLKLGLFVGVPKCTLGKKLNMITLKWKAWEDVEFINRDITGFGLSSNDFKFFLL